ncbi:MAG: DEAD/DEAH box helicase family protein [Bacteroidales bacterium]|nr:DEAD/DEAH box helicase family protein [Bacteroidales bacterium]
MELKNYQQQVINDLEQYLECLDKFEVKSAFKEYWQSKGISLPLQSSKYLKPYNDEIKNVPNVTLKVPTAGGKTFIACNAVRSIFNHYYTNSPQVVTWFVASDSILKQTYRNLSDVNHPYRQKIDSLFNGRVCVADKQQALSGQGISPNELRNQLTIFVLSIQSFASNNKEGRKSYQENQNLAEHTKHYNDGQTVNGADETALINLLAHLSPVVIIDESHNFTASLRLDAIKAIKPCFILDLTATPRENSNIISFVNAMELKKNEMVKLPVIVYNKNNKNDVISTAVNLRNNLELQAIENEKLTGKYIRPIVLFQAQPKGNEDNITFEKIKQQLVESGINEEEIKIKTANKDELKNTELLSKDCKVRYIITVNALKEGWDCPFAYILASISNRSSQVEVEQILGRILRQPYTRKHKSSLLNMSYVFTSSDNFNATIQNVIKGLECAGFSSKDYRAKDDTENTVEQQTEDTTHILQTDIFAFDEENEETVFDTEQVKESICNTNKPDNTLQKDIDIALQTQEEYEEKIEQTEITVPIEDMQQNSYRVSDKFIHSERLSLPQFSLQITNSNDIFAEGNENILLSEETLSEGMDLTKADKFINFEFVSSEIKRLDIEVNNNDTQIKTHGVTQAQQTKLKSYIDNLSSQGKKRFLVSAIVNKLNYDFIVQKQLENYVLSVLDGKTEEDINLLHNNINEVVEKFKIKINSLILQHRKDIFDLWLNTSKIQCNLNYTLPNNIIIYNPVTDIPKSLYVAEDKMNGFERKVISSVAELDNVEFWHRNLSKGRGFYINGFINHYPDFIVKLTNGKVLLIETKGDDRDNSDSKNKLYLGKKWQEKVGDNFRYFMVFENNSLDEAITLNELVNIIKQMM